MVQQQVQWGHRAALWVATGFGIGRAPVAPGTFGTLLGVPVYLLLQPLSTYVYVAAVSLLFVLGAWVSHSAEQQLGRHDHPAIVCDEVVGYLITMWQAPFGLWWAVTGFVLFRLVDIAKPYPVSQMERLPGGIGVMADDALAGVYALAVMQAAVWYLGVY